MIKIICESALTYSALKGTAGDALTGSGRFDDECISSQADERTHRLAARLWQLLSRREILITTMLYGLNGFAQIIANEVFPLWVVTSAADGGFGYSSHHIGNAIMMSGPVTVACQVFAYPVLVRKYGILRVYRLGCLLYCITTVLMPAVSLLGGLGSKLVSDVAIIAALALLGVSGQMVLISVFVMINNSAYTADR